MAIVLLLLAGLTLWFAPSRRAYAAWALAFVLGAVFVLWAAYQGALGAASAASAPNEQAFAFVVQRRLPGVSAMLGAQLLLSAGLLLFRRRMTKAHRVPAGGQVSDRREPTTDISKVTSMDDAARRSDDDAPPGAGKSRAFSNVAIGVLCLALGFAAGLSVAGDAVSEWARSQWNSFAQQPRAEGTYAELAGCGVLLECPRMRAVQGSTIWIEDPHSSDGFRHEVRIEGFAVSDAISYSHWKACVDAGGCGSPGNPLADDAHSPVHFVSWLDARQYVDWLSRETGRGYRLLTPIEWEYLHRLAQSDATFGGSVIGNEGATLEWTQDCTECADHVPVITRPERWRRGVPEAHPADFQGPSIGFRVALSLHSEAAR